MDFLVSTVTVGLDLNFQPPDEVPQDVPNYVRPDLIDKVTEKYKITVFDSIIPLVSEEVW